MKRKTNPVVVIIDSGINTEKLFPASYKVLEDKVAHIMTMGSNFTWKDALGFHDLEKSNIQTKTQEGEVIEVFGDTSFITEGTDIILLHDNVVLHQNVADLISQAIPDQGSVEPFTIEESDKHGPEVNDIIKQKNEAYKDLREQIEENNYAYLNCPIAWWEEEPKIFTGYVAFKYGTTKELYQPDTKHTNADEFYTEQFKGVIWPTIKGQVVDIQNDHSKEDAWKDKIIPEFPDEFKPRDKFPTAIAYSEEMHKPFFSLDEGLNQHVAMVFYDSPERVDGMPL